MPLSFSKTTAVKDLTLIPAEEDRISALPDDIIHQILSRLNSPHQYAARFSVLSKTWNHIYHSYPTLKFHDSYLESKQLQERIATVEACKKLFRRRSSNSTTLPTKSVTIKTSFRRWDSNLLLGGFLDDILDLTARVSPEEIDITACPASSSTRYIIPPSFLLDGSIQFWRSLTILKLEHCSFRDYVNPNFEGFGVSLKLLSLGHVWFPDDGILDAMVSSATCLENLSLDTIYGIKRLQVSNHPHLKSITARNFKRAEFHITGLGSLQTLTILSSTIGCFHVSSTPNLKYLDIKGGDARDLSNGDVLKLILELPSLESIIYDARDKFQISKTTQLRQIKLKWWSSIVQLAASVMDDDLITSFITTLSKVNSTMKVAPLLLELCRFRASLQLTSPHSKLILCDDQTTNELLFSPAIEHLKFPSRSVNVQDNFLDNVLHTCHPKFISLTGEEDQIPNSEFLLALQCICKQIVERGYCTRCGSAYKCWHNQLKDVKLVTRLTNGSIKEDKAVDISEDIFSFLIKGDRVCFILDWH